MKRYFSVLFIGFLLSGCNRIEKQIDEAKEARKKSDSILKAFKTVDQYLDSLNSATQSKNDSNYQTSIDTSLSR